MCYETHKRPNIPHIGYGQSVIIFFSKILTLKFKTTAILTQTTFALLKSLWEDIHPLEESDS